MVGKCAPVRRDEISRHGQAEAAGLAGGEGLEEVGEHLRRHSWARVFHRDAHPLIIAGDRELDDAPIRGGLERVAQQVVDDAAQGVAVCFNARITSNLTPRACATGAIS